MGKIDTATLKWHADFVGSQMQGSGNLAVARLAQSPRTLSYKANRMFPLFGEAGVIKNSCHSGDVLPGHAFGELFSDWNTVPRALPYKLLHRLNITVGNLAASVRSKKIRKKTLIMNLIYLGSHRLALSNLWQRVLA